MCVCGGGVGGGSIHRCEPRGRDIWVPTGLRVLHHAALLSHRYQPDESLLIDLLNFCLFEAGSFWPRAHRDLPSSVSQVMEPKGCSITAQLRQGLAMQSKLNLNLLHSSGWPYLLNLPRAETTTVVHHPSEPLLIMRAISL